MSVFILSVFSFPMLSIISDGGSFFMIPIMILLIVCLGLTIYGFTKGDKEYVIKLITSISLFALVWGFLGQSLGLIGALDQIESFDKVSPQIIGAGIKTTLLPAVFGMVAFLVGRAGIIALRLKG